MLDPAVLAPAATPPAPPADDPKLVAAAKDIYEAQKAATKAGTPLSPDDIDAYVKDKTGGAYSGTDVGKYLGAINTKTSEWAHPSTWLPALGSEARAIANGATFGGAQHLVDLVGGPGAKDKWNLGSEVFGDAQPAINTEMNVAGSMLTGKKLPFPKTYSVPAGMAVGGATGLGTAMAASGFNAEPGHRVEAMTDPSNLILPSAIGAGAAGILGLASGMKNFAEPGMARLRHAVEESGGADALKARLPEIEQQGLGDQYTLGDLSDPLRASAKYSVQNSPSAAMDRIKFTAARNANAPQRMLDAFRTTLAQQAPAGAGMPDLNSAVAEDAAKLAARKFGSEAYGALRENNPTVANTEMPKGVHPLAGELERQITLMGIDPDGPQAAALRAQLGGTEPTGSTKIMSDLMKQPRVATAIARAQQTGEIGATPEPRDQASFEKMFQFYQDLKDAGDKAIAQGGGKSQYGFNLKEAANIVNKHLEENVDLFGDTSRQYRTLMQNRRAFDTGHDWAANADSREIARQAEKMTPDQLHNARLAMASDMVAKFRNPTQAQPFTRQIMNLGAEGASESALQDKLMAVFGDDQTYRGYMKYAELNHELGRMTGAYNNSDTYRNLMAGQTGASPLETGVKSMTSGIAVPGWNLVKSQLVRTAAGRVLPALRRAQADAMSGPLMTTGTKNISDVLDAVTRSRSALPAIATQGVPAALSGLLTRQP